MQLQESGEMYLETIYILSQEMSKVRSIDVVEKMGYSKPSVSRAMSLLKTAGLVTQDEEGYLVLTKEGKDIAKKTYERHTILTDFFVNLGVNAKTAAADACKIEHVISDDTFKAIKKQMKAQKIDELLKSYEENQ